LLTWVWRPVQFGCTTVAEAMALGQVNNIHMHSSYKIADAGVVYKKDAAKRVTKIFPEPVSLEFEKVIFSPPFFLRASSSDT